MTLTVTRSLRPALFFGVLAVAAGLSSVSAAAETRPAEPSRPNILFTIADDRGYPHASACGCRWVKTPAFEEGPIEPQRKPK